MASHSAVVKHEFAQVEKCRGKQRSFCDSLRDGSSAPVLRHAAIYNERHFHCCRFWNMPHVSIAS